MIKKNFKEKKTCWKQISNMISLISKTKLSANQDYVTGKELQQL